jgi:hypothetical protein
VGNDIPSALGGHETDTLLGSVNWLRDVVREAALSLGAD